jgi:hypothetical protein
MRLTQPLFMAKDMDNTWAVSEGSHVSLKPVQHSPMATQITQL